VTERLRIDACLFCAGRALRPLRQVRDPYSGDRFHVVRCLGCGGGFLEDPPPPEDLARYYENDLGALMHGRPNPLFAALQGVALVRDAAPLLNRLAPGASIVELGSGDGRLAASLAARGWRVASRDMIPPERWPHPSVPYRRADLNALTPDDLSVDGAPPGGVILRHVLEHLSAPRDVLARLRAAGAGHVLIVVPNLDSPFASLLGEWWPYWDPPRHLSHFTLGSLEALAAGSGWKVLEHTSYGIDEVVSSVHRWLIHRERPGRLARLATRAVHAKSPLAAVSSALASPVGTTVLRVLLGPAEDA
jgi:hypothetical protein